MGAPMLLLRPLRLEDEAAFRAAHQEMASEGFDFSIGLEPQTSWREYVDSVRDRRSGINLPGGWVPEHFLVADVAGVIVGRASIRHVLNEYLARVGGHIGYGVLRRYRRRGYATEILRQSLVIARAQGVDRVLVTCDDDNVGSAAVIEACGGVLESVIDVAEGAPKKRRYWIG